MIFLFGNCELDVDRVVFRRDGHDVPIEPQVFDLLCCLVERRGRLLRKEELLDLVWGDRFVSESALTTRIKSVRQAVGDDGSRQEVIRTVHGKGYEFIADVRVRDEVDVAGRPTAGRSTLPLALHPLVGREDLIPLIENDLASARLVTLVGTGGVGKTSVAYEVARRRRGAATATGSTPSSWPRSRASTLPSRRSPRCSA